MCFYWKFSFSISTISPFHCSYECQGHSVVWRLSLISFYNFYCSTFLCLFNKVSRNLLLPVSNLETLLGINLLYLVGLIYFNLLICLPLILCFSRLNWSLCSSVVVFHWLSRLPVSFPFILFLVFHNHLNR